jgi:hypothetical protein
MYRTLAVAIVLAGIFMLYTAQKILVDDPIPRIPTVEEQVFKVHEELQTAASKLDADALYAHVLDAQVPPIIENGKVMETRERAMKVTKSGFEGIRSLSYNYSKKDVVPLAANAALWIGQGTATAVLSDGREITAPFAESIVFVQTGKTWKVLHGHRSSPNER